MPRSRHTPRWPRCLAAALGGMLLAGCTHDIPLHDSDRARLGKEPVIHVVHYRAPEPVVKTNPKTSAPTPAALQGSVGSDLAGQLSRGLARLIGKKQRLRNLRMEKETLPLPVARDAAAHQTRFRRGMVLETWVQGWSLEPARDTAGSYVLTLRARSRLTRIEGGQVLWLSRTCQVGTDSHNTRVPAGEIGKTHRLRKAADAARDECVRQLARDFLTDEHKK